jgi:hypothetical protein
MTFHYGRIRATRKVKNLRYHRLIKEGAVTLNLWNAMPIIKLGTIADDWNAVGSDMKQAMSQYADDCG